MTEAGAGLGRRLISLAALVLLAGCGFRPVYAPAGSASGPQRELAAIDVALMPDRAGQLLRQALQERLDRGDGFAKRFTLSVSYGIAGDAVAIQRDSTNTRLREIATAQWTLKALDPAQTTVASGIARALDGVNIIDQQYFAADLEGETVARRLSDRIAEQITLQLAAFFARHPTAT